PVVGTFRGERAGARGHVGHGRRVPVHSGLARGVRGAVGSAAGRARHDALHVQVALAGPAPQGGHEAARAVRYEGDAGVAVGVGVRVSVRCFGYPLPWYRPVAMAAERLGFDGVWIPDHAVAMTATDSAYPYSATGKPSFQPDTPFADPFTMLGHLAAVTERVRLGIGVFVLPLRHPLLAARAAMSVQELSGGRLVLG